jgi:5-methylcytosine-specific restriction enzyme A
MASSPKKYTTSGENKYERAKRYESYNKIRYEQMPHHKLYNTKEWKKLREQVRKENCEQCGSETKLRVHHIVPIDVNPDLSLVTENLQTLCERCHKRTHAEFLKQKQEQTDGVS